MGYNLCSADEMGIRHHSPQDRGYFAVGSKFRDGAKDNHSFKADLSILISETRVLS